MRTAIVVAAVLSLAACASVQTNPTEVAVTAIPAQQSFGIGASLEVPAGTPLVLASVDGQKAYCSTVNVVHQIGDNRGACFFDTKNAGYFDKWYVLGTLSSSTMGGISIPYSVIGTQQYQAAQVQHAQVQVAAAPAAGMTEAQARAQCAYQAKVANMTNPGIIGGFGAGLGVGGACIDYYRHIGVIR